MTSARSGGREPTLADLEAVAAHAKRRAALYRRKTLLGRGDPRRLAELDRAAAGAAGRLRSASPVHPGANSAP